jgi:1-acyl-sn-glycerol-3-phosphate acyltransferase
MIVLTVLLSLRIADLKLKENITDIFPQDEQLEQVEILFNSSGINNNLIIHVFSTDSNRVMADSIIKISDRLDSLLTANYSDHIHATMLTYSDSLVNVLYDYFLKYLPLYLDDADYQKIDERISEEGITSTLQGNLRTIISPIGLFGSRMVQIDPFGLAQLPLTNFQKSQFDENFSIYKNHLFSKDKRHLLYFLELSNQANETAKNGDLITGLDEMISELNMRDVTIEYFGAPAMAVANAKRIKSDISLSVTLAVVIILILIILYFRSVREFFLVLLPGAFGVLAALAILSLLRDQISLISLGIGSIMVGITVDFALHLFTHHKDDPDMEGVYKSITQPILMSSFTTACAFFALAFINSDAMIDLGLFVGIGVLIASLFSLLVLPHMLSHKDQKERKAPSFFESSLKKFASLNIYRNRAAQIIFAIVTVVSIFFWGKIVFNSDLMSLNYAPEYLQKSEENIQAISNLSGKKLYLTVAGENVWDALGKAKNLNKELTNLKENNDILGFSSLNTLIPDIETQKARLDKWNAYWQKNNSDELQQTVLEEAEALGFNRKFYPGLGAYLNKEYHLVGNDDLTEVVKMIGNKYMIESRKGISLITVVTCKPDNKGKIIKALSSIEEVQILDREPIAEKLLEILSKDFDKLITISLAAIFAILLLIYGRIEMALITIAPIALGWLWTVGLMALTGLTFNIVNIIIGSLIFGLGIDYSIFNMKGLSIKYAKGHDHRVSFKVSILLSGITTLVGIGVLIFAQHPAIRSIALIAIIGISSVIFLTLFVQDALYAFFIQNRKDRGLEPFTFLSFILSVIAFSVFLTGCLILMFVRIVFYIPVWPKKQKLFFHWMVMMYCRFILYVMVNLDKKIIDKRKADFSKPSVIIANHHSFLDILIMLMFHPKVVMVTNNWVYNSPFFGIVVRYADFILASDGLENQLEKAAELVKKGYSIVVFPEGTRSATIDVNRFHKGAFYLAEKLQLDIQPIILHGTHHGMPKKDGFYLRNQLLSIKFLDRISLSDERFGAGYKERTKSISRYFREEYSNIRQEKEDHKYFKWTIYKNYLYKGPVIEWYYRIKIRLENFYQVFHQHLPKEGTVIDIGCGFGFLGYSLAFSSSRRKVIGLDYDKNKIEIAANCPVKPDNLLFMAADAVTYDYPKAQAFIVSDMLHYLKDDEQQILMDKLMACLSSGGVILVRDGDREMRSRHFGTKITEFFSVNIGFNRTRNKLNYISEKWLRELADKNRWHYERIENSKWTSNTISILRKPGDGEI